VALTSPAGGTPMVVTMGMVVALCGHGDERNSEAFRDA